MDILLDELKLIPNLIPDLAPLKKYTIRSNVLQNAGYRYNKLRFIQILQSVNPNFKIQYTKDKVLQVLVDYKVLVIVNMYRLFNKDYFMKLDFTQQIVASVYTFKNKLKVSKKSCFHDYYIYDGKYIDDIISRYYTYEEFYKKFRGTILYVVIPNNLLKLIYSYTTSSVIKW